MMVIRRFGYIVGRRPALAIVIIVVLPVVLAACGNGGSSGPGY